MNRGPITTIGFDADDTLWHNENLFVSSHQQFAQLLAQYHDAATVERTLFETEMRNLELYGYGIKSFALSSIETAIELSEGAIPAREIKQMIDLSQAMLRHPVELLPGVEATVDTLQRSYRVILITKGDLHDQQRKVDQSGIAALFSEVEVVSEKKAANYQQVLKKLQIDPTRFLMVGNSLKSDILPILEIGGWAVHVPYAVTWAHERCDPPPSNHPRFERIEQLSELPGVVAGFAPDR